MKKKKFCPSEEQVQIRRSARGLYNNGMYLGGEWVARIPTLTLSKWRNWENTKGFMDWWSELLPEHGGVTLSDLKALEFEANKSLMRAMMEGDLAATKIVISMVSQAREAEKITDNGMEEWFDSSTEQNGWTQEWN